MLLAAGIALYKMASIGDELGVISEKNIPLSQIVTNIAHRKLEQAANFERVLRFGLNAEIENQVDNIPANEAKAEFRRLHSLVLQDIEGGKELIDQTEGFILDQEINEEYKRARTQLKVIDENYTNYLKSATQIFDLISANELREAEFMSLTILAEEDQLRKALDELLEQIQKLTHESSFRTKDLQINAINSTIYISVLSLVVGLALAAVITRSITKPLSAAVHAADEIAAGNKDIVITERSYSGEVGRLIKAMENMSNAVKESEEELKERADQLSRSNAELEQFAYVASHDLQEPLRMVTSYTQLVARRYSDKLDETGLEFINFAVDGVNRMQSLINDLLSFSRVGREERPFTKVKLKNVVDNACKNLQIVIEESDAEITHDELPTIMGDPSQLTQLLQNLMGNALKFRADKKPKIHIGVKKDGRLWSISVADNGIGIEPQYYDRIFNIFQRLHTKDKYSGTGIGLAICKKIVERHGGRISVESILGEGSTFRFTFPIMVEYDSRNDGANKGQLTRGDDEHGEQYRPAN